MRWYVCYKHAYTCSFYPNMSSHTHTHIVPNSEYVYELVCLLQTCTHLFILPKRSEKKFRQNHDLNPSAIHTYIHTYIPDIRTNRIPCTTKCFTARDCHRRDTFPTPRSHRNHKSVQTHRLNLRSVVHTPNHQPRNGH
jgi:hypothetical protein